MQRGNLLAILGSGAPISEILQQIANVARLMNRRDSRTAVLLNDGQGYLRPAATAGLGTDYTAAVRKVEIRADYPSCGRAAALGCEVIVEDVSENAAWRPFEGLARKYEIAACWSFPIAYNDQVLGTLAIYHRNSRRPTDLELDAMRYLASVAALALIKTAEGLGPFPLWTDAGEVAPSFENSPPTVSVLGRYLPLFVENSRAAL